MGAVASCFQSLFQALTTCFTAIINGIVAVVKAIINVRFTSPKFSPTVPPQPYQTVRSAMLTRTNAFQGIVAVVMAIVSCLTCGKAGKKHTSAV